MPYKRIVKKLVAIVLIVIFITSCSIESNYNLDPKNPVKIVVWHYYNGLHKSAFDDIIADFNSTIGMEKGIRVEGYSYGGVQELTERLNLIAQNEGSWEDFPNIFAGYGGTVIGIDKLGKIATLDKYITKEELNEYVDDFIKEGKSLSGGVKIFPIAKATENLFVNKTDWNQFVSAVTEEDKNNIYEDISNKHLETWEGIYKAAEVYYNWTDDKTPNVLKDGKAMFGVDSVANFYITANKQLGRDIFSVMENGVKFNLDKEINKKIWDFYIKGVTNGYIAAYGRFRSDDVKTGSLLMFVGSTSGAKYFPVEVTLGNGEKHSIESDILELPVFQGSKKVAIQQGAGMLVAKSTPEKEYASVEFLKFFTKSENNIEFSFNSGYLPVKKEALNSEEMNKRIGEYKTSGNRQNVNAAVALDVSIKQVRNYEMYTTPSFVGANEARIVIENTIVKYSSKGSDEQFFLEFIDELSKNVEREIK